MSMISYERALSRILSRVPKPVIQSVPLHRALGQILATPVWATQALPPFKKSFMDGYALRSKDVREAPVVLNIIGRITAGVKSHFQISRNEAVKIMTGAPVPDTADAVQKVEKTRTVEAGIEILEPVAPAQHVASVGSEVEKGQLVLEKGRRIGPREVSILACFGVAEVQIHKPPEVAIISTGDELIDIRKTPTFGQIRNSNAHMLWAQCQSAGVKADVEPIVMDDPEKIREAIRCVRNMDLVLLSGGVSMGEFDFVHTVLVEEGVDILFHKVAIKPGKPIMVGLDGERMIFGLPGNPVSAFVTFVLFVKPALQQWCGVCSGSFQKIKVCLEKKIKHKPGKLFLMPGKVQKTGTQITACPISTKGSADMVGFARANALLFIPSDRERLPEGSIVEAVLLDGFQRFV